MLFVSRFIDKQTTEWKRLHSFYYSVMHMAYNQPIDAKATDDACIVKL